MNKKLWYISKYSVSPQFGTPTRHYFLGKYLQKVGYDVTLVSSRSAELLHPPQRKTKPVITKEEGFTQVMLPGPVVSYGLNLRRLLTWFQFEIRLRKWIKQQPNLPDVVMVSSLSILTLLTGVWLKKKFGICLIVEIRDIHPLSMIEVSGIPAWLPPILVLKKVEKQAFRFADIIVGTMPNLREHIRSIDQKSASKCMHLPMGYDPDFYAANDSEIGNYELDLPKNKFIVGYVGSFSPSQATGVIFDTILIMANHDPNVHFLLVGDGPEKQAGLEKISDCGNYTSVPRVHKKYVNGILEQCQVVLNPWKDLSIYRFGVSPNKWIDYMWAAKPIIVCFNGYRSIIDEAQCGSFIPVEDPDTLRNEILRYVAMTPEERERIGNNGKVFLEKHLQYATLADKLKSEIQRISTLERV